MLWTSLRLGWGNTGPVILLSLLPLLMTAMGGVERPSLMPASSVQLRPIETDAAGNLLMRQELRVVAVEARDLQSRGD